MYGVIFEHKAEQPLIQETRPLSYDEANKRMRDLMNIPDVIRVAVFKLEYASGNETLIKTEQE